MALPFNQIPNSLGTNANSAPDIVTQQGSNSAHYEAVAFDKTGQLLFTDWTNAYSPSYHETRFAPPSSTTFRYSPALCGLSVDSSGATVDQTRYVAAVTGNALYLTSSTETDWASGATYFQAWTAIGNVIPASAPDCVVYPDNSVHVVLLTSTGTIADVYRTGKTGGWTTKDLGGFWPGNEQRRFAKMLRLGKRHKATRSLTEGLQNRRPSRVQWHREPYHFHARESVGRGSGESTANDC